jgi:hypothetical protein
MQELETIHSFAAFCFFHSCVEFRKFFRTHLYLFLGLNRRSHDSEKGTGGFAKSRVCEKFAAPG